MIVLVAEVSNHSNPLAPWLDLISRLVRVKCSPEDTIGDFKKLIAAQIGTDPKKIVLKKGYMTASLVRPQYWCSSKVRHSQGPYHPRWLRNQWWKKSGLVSTRNPPLQWKFKKIQAVIGVFSRTLLSTFVLSWIWD